MRSGSLSARGYSLMAVCGSRFDPALMPARPELSFRQAPDLTWAAIQAVRRARLISYMERNILPHSSFRATDAGNDERDEYCIHLILHRHNCLYGAIRCQFYQMNPECSDLAPPLFIEVLNRNQMPDEIKYVILREVDSIGAGSPSFMEISSWLVNPDLRRCAALAFALPAAVWALVGQFPEFPGVSTLRASNAAARTLLQLGGIPIRHQQRDLVFEDKFYRGPVQLMALHSRRYHPSIAPLVQECLDMLLGHGVMTHQAF